MMEKQLLILQLFAGFCFSQDPISVPPVFGTGRNGAVGNSARSAPPTGISGTTTTPNNRPLVNLDNYQPQVTSSVLKFIADIQTSSLENAITIQAELNELAYSQTPLIPDPRIVDTSTTRVKRQAVSNDQPQPLNQPSPTSDNFFNFLTKPADSSPGVPPSDISRSSETIDFPRRDGPASNNINNAGTGSQPTNLFPPNRIPVNNAGTRAEIRPSPNRQPPRIPPSNIPPYLPNSGPQRPSLPATPGSDRRQPLFRNPSFSLEGDATPPIIPDPAVTRPQPLNNRPTPPQFVHRPSPNPPRQYNDNQNQQDRNRNQGNNLPVNRRPALVRMTPPGPPNSNQRVPANSVQRPEQPPYNVPRGQPRPPIPFNNQLRRQTPNIQQSPQNDARRPPLSPLQRQPPRRSNANPSVFQNNSPNDNRAIQTPVWRLPLYQNQNPYNSLQRNNSRTVPGPTYVPQIVNWPNTRYRPNFQANQGNLPTRQPQYNQGRPNRLDWFDQFDGESDTPTYPRTDYNNRYPYPYRFPYTQDRDSNQYNPAYENPYEQRYPNLYPSRPSQYPIPQDFNNRYEPRPTQYPYGRYDPSTDPYRNNYGQASNFRQPYVFPSGSRGPQQTRPNTQTLPYSGFPRPGANSEQPYAQNPFYRRPEQQNRYPNDPRVSNRFPSPEGIGRPPAISTVAGEEEVEVPLPRILQNLQRYQNLIPTPRRLNKEPSYLKALNVIRSFKKGEVFVFNGYIVQNFYIFGDYELAQEHFRTLPNVNVTYLKTDTYSGYTGDIQNYRVTLCKECGLGKRYPVIEIVGLKKVYPGVVKRFLYTSSYEPLFDPLLSDGETNPTVGPTPPSV